MAACAGRAFTHVNSFFHIFRFAHSSSFLTAMTVHLSAEGVKRKSLHHRTTPIGALQ